MDRGAARLGDVEVLVLDEADQMFDMGFLPAVRRIVAGVPRAPDPAFRPPSARGRAGHAS
jgi:superfamily II DNA/RNA helicase